jgi:hypothetical protein
MDPVLATTAIGVSRSGKSAPQRGVSDERSKRSAAFVARARANHVERRRTSPATR